MPKPTPQEAYDDVFARYTRARANLRSINEGLAARRNQRAAPKRKIAGLPGKLKKR